MKAAIYCRVSTDNQEAEGTSLQTQLEAALKRCKDTWLRLANHPIKIHGAAFIRYFRSAIGSMVRALMVRDGRLELAKRTFLQIDEMKSVGWHIEFNPNYFRWQEYFADLCERFNKPEMLEKYGRLRELEEGPIMRLMDIAHQKWLETGELHGLDINHPRVKSIHEEAHTITREIIAWLEEIEPKVAESARRRQAII